MKHQIKVRSEAYYPNVHLAIPGMPIREEDLYARLFGTVVKTTANSVWIKDSPNVISLRAIISRTDDPPKEITRKWMLKDNGLWHLVGSKAAPRQINFKLNPLLEFTFG